MYVMTQATHNIGDETMVDVKKTENFGGNDPLSRAKAMLRKLERELDDFPTNGFVQDRITEILATLQEADK